MQRKYIKIPNEIFEELAKTRFSNYEFRYLWVLIRKTLGWNKESDWISNSQFVKETGIQKWGISKTQKRLIQRKVVVKIGNKLRLNLNYGAWIRGGKELRGKTEKLSIKTTAKIVVNRGNRVVNLDNGVVNLDTHKEHLYKEHLYKEEEKKTSSSNKSDLEGLGDLIALKSSALPLATADTTADTSNQVEKKASQTPPQTPKMNTKDLVDSYKRKISLNQKPTFWGSDMRWSQSKWWCLDGGAWKEFVGSEEDIKWKNK